MPRTRSLAWSELKIGVLTIAALIIASVLIVSLMGTRGFVWQRYSLRTKFPDAVGLTSGSPVRVAGVEVGTVKGVSLSDDEVEVIFEVNKSVRSRITDKSVATLGSVSLLGQAAVDIKPMSTGTPIPDNGYVRSAPPKGTLSDVTESALGSLDQIEGLVKDARNGKGSFGKLLTDDALYVELQQFAGAAADVTKALKSGRGSIGRLINDPQAANALNASLKNLQDVTARIDAGEGSLGHLLKDRAFSDSLTGATANLQTITDRLNRGQGTAGRLITDTALYDRLNQVAGRLDDVVARLDNGEGTAGQLLKDKQLYENMNKTVLEFQGLLAEIRKDPKHYLNVKVSIF